jgi:hypothetical protein
MEMSTMAKNKEVKTEQKEHWEICYQELLKNSAKRKLEAEKFFRMGFLAGVGSGKNCKEGEPCGCFKGERK